MTAVPTDSEFLSARHLRIYEAMNPPLGPFLLEPVLPPLSHHHYTTGGCFILALALEDASGLPLWVAERDGRPTHAMVIDYANEEAIDAWGRRPTRYGLAGLNGTSMTPLGLLAFLRASPPNGPIIVSDIEQPDSWKAARRTARFLLGGT